MNILLNCELLNDMDVAEIESLSVGPSIMWFYIKLLLFMKSARSDVLQKSRVAVAARKLGVTTEQAEQYLGELSKFTHLVANMGQAYQIPEITRELLTLKGRLEGGKRASVNKGLCKGKDQGLGLGDLSDRPIEGPPIFNTAATEPFTKVPSGYEKVGDFTYLPEDQRIQLEARFGADVLKAAIALLDNDVGQNSHKPVEFEKLKDKAAKSAFYALQKWAIPEAQRRATQGTSPPRPIRPTAKSRREQIEGLGEKTT